MTGSAFLFTAFLCVCIYYAFAAQLDQLYPENAGTSIADGLKKCYNVSSLRDRNNRLPATINVLIDLIRRVEDAPMVSTDQRNLATQIVHRFRQDGIRKVKANNPSIQMPYTPVGYQLFRNRAILWKLIPGNAHSFANDTLNDMEQCSLHYMLSNTLETEQRPNEMFECRRSGQYRRRPKRAEDFSERSTNKPEVVSKEDRTLKLNENNESSCPVESGVVYDHWGSIQAGTVLAAMAAGLSEQTVAVLDSTGQKTQYINSVFGVTIAADLVETALMQVPLYNTYNVGDSGGWNSTLSPRWYLLDKRKPNVLSNADLRADMDGLIIGSNIKRWISSHNKLKLSQILDMYYSNRRVFGEEHLRACERGLKWREYATDESLVAETMAFAYLYNDLSVLPATLGNFEIDKFVQQAVTEFSKQDTNLNDVKCELEPIDRVATDLVIVLDTSCQYKHIYPALSYLLDNIDVNKFESSYTIINAGDGNVLANTTGTILDFHEILNISTYDAALGGFNVYNFNSKVENYLSEKHERMKSAGNKQDAKSAVVLMVARTASTDNTYFMQERFTEVYDKYYPDTTFMVLGIGSPDQYKNLVRDQRHIFILDENSREESRTITTLNKLSETILSVPRKLINPSCGSTMSGDSNSYSVDIYVEPTTKNLYKVPVNYLRGENGKSIRVTRQNNANVSICHSRTEPSPKQCEIMSNTERTFTVDACEEDCEPFYMIIHAGDSKEYKCIEKDCRFLDNVKLRINLEGFECSSASNLATFASMIFAFTFTLKLLFN